MLPKLDAATKLQMALAATKEWMMPIELDLIKKGWALQRGTPIGTPPPEKTTPLLRASHRLGRLLIALQPTGDLVIIVARMRQVDETPAGQAPHIHEVEDWRVRMSATVPAIVVVANADLAAHDPDDLRLDQV